MIDRNTTGEPNKGSPCPHSDGKNTVVCWICAENGFSPQSARGSSSPVSPVDFEKDTFIVLDDSPLEVLPPGEGIEVGAQSPYPGIEAISGPIIQKGRWSDEPEQKEFAPSRPTIFGVQRRWFWIVLIGLLVVLLIGVAIGAAVGVTQSKHSTDSSAVVVSPEASTATSALSPTSSGMSTPAAASLSSPTSSLSSTQATSALTTSSTLEKTSATSPATSPATSSTAIVDEEKPSSTTTSPTSTPTKPDPTGTTATTTVLVTPPVSSPDTVTLIATPTPTPPTTITTTEKATPASSSEKTSSTLFPAQSNGYCLGYDGSTYTDPNTGSQFRIECDVAHQGKDIANPEAETMEDCVSLCADNSRCVGAIWYNVGPQGTDLNYCWLKSSLDDSDIRDTPDAQSVVRL